MPGFTVYCNALTGFVTNSLSLCFFVKPLIFRNKQKMNKKSLSKSPAEFDVYSFRINIKKTIQIINLF